MRGKADARVLQAHNLSSLCMQSRGQVRHVGGWTRIVHTLPERPGKDCTQVTAPELAEMLEDFPDVFHEAKDAASAAGAI